MLPWFLGEATAAPALEVIGPSGPLANKVAYPVVAPVGVPTVVAFELRNTGDQPLYLYSLDARGPAGVTADWVTLPELQYPPVPPGGWAEAELELTPSSEDWTVEFFAYSGDTARPFLSTPLVPGEAPAPDLVVGFDGDGLAPGDALEVGALPEPAVVQLELDNVGTGPLQVSEVTVGAADNVNCAIVRPTGAFTVAAGDGALLAIDLRPDDPGPFSCPITIRSDDPDQGAFRVDLEGTRPEPPTVPALSAPPSVTVVAGESVTFDLRNAGDGTLHVTGIAAEPAIGTASVALPAEVAPGGRLAVSFRADRTASGAGELRVTSDSGGAPGTVTVIPVSYRAAPPANRARRGCEHLPGPEAGGLLALLALAARRGARAPRVR